MYLEQIQAAPALRMELLPAAVRVDGEYIPEMGGWSLPPEAFSDISLAVSVVVWWVFDVALFLLAVPFVPFLFRRGSGGGGGDRVDGTAARRPPERTCPECGFATRNPAFDHCPRDGTELRQR